MMNHFKETSLYMFLFFPDLPAKSISSTTISFKMIWIRKLIEALSDGTIYTYN